MNPSTLTSTITAATSIIAILVAVYALWAQNRQSAKTLAVTIVHDYFKEFNSPAMMRQRLQAATFLLRSGGEADEPPAELYDVFDHIDRFGNYFNRGLFDPAMVWGMFYHWWGYYCRIGMAYVDKFEKEFGGAQYYADLRLLYEHLTQFGLRSGKMPPEQVYFSEENMRRFLEYEIAACSENAP